MRSFGCDSVEDLSGAPPRAAAIDGGVSIGGMDDSQPGAVITEHEPEVQLTEDALDVKSRAHLDASHPIGRMGEPDEVGEVATISAPTCSFVNGAYRPIDGGPNPPRDGGRLGAVVIVG